MSLIYFSFLQEFRSFVWLGHPPLSYSTPFLLSFDIITQWLQVLAAGR